MSDFAGHYSEPSFGDVIFSVRDGTLEYRWGAVYGPAQVNDPPREWRIEIAGAGQLVTFEFAGPGPARAISLQGVTFLRR